jgi:ferrochelatase
MKPSESTIGLLVMAYGGPSNLDDVEPYLMDVRGYRPTSPDVVHEVRERYRAIGGRSPILERTRAQANAIEAVLNEHKQDFKVFVGMRHWHPFIRDTLAEMHEQGIERTVGLVMAPHYSRMSVEAYFKKIEEVNSNMRVARIAYWHLLPEYLDALVDRVQVALERFPPSVRASVPVIFTAHSLPERILEWGDPYPHHLRETVEVLMQRLAPRSYEFAYQSAAISPDPWLGPDASEAMESYAAEGNRHLLICPIGFVCEHVEILYDIDIVYQDLAKKLGVQLERIEMLNDSPKLIKGLGRLVRQTAQDAGWL